MQVTCKVVEDDSGVAKALKNAIKSGLVKRFKLDEMGLPLDVQVPGMVACLLDPRYKVIKTYVSTFCKATI